MIQIHGLESSMCLTFRHPRKEREPRARPHPRLPPRSRPPVVNEARAEVAEVEVAGRLAVPIHDEGAEEGVEEEHLEGHVQGHGHLDAEEPVGQCCPVTSAKVNVFMYV